MQAFVRRETTRWKYLVSYFPISYCTFKQVSENTVFNTIFMKWPLCLRLVRKGQSRCLSQIVHQLTCSLFQVANFDWMSYQIPVDSDLFTVILFSVTLSTMQVSGDSEFREISCLLNPKMQNNLRIPLSWNHLLFLVQSFFRFLRESLIYYLWFHFSRWN